MERTFKTGDKYKVIGASTHAGHIVTIAGGYEVAPGRECYAGIVREQAKTTFALQRSLPTLDPECNASQICLFDPDQLAAIED